LRVLSSDVTYPSDRRPIAARLTTLRLVGSIAAVIVVVLLALVPHFAPEYIVTAAILILLDCYFAQCWNLVAGYAGQLALGQTVFLAIGGYTSSILLTKYGVSPWLGVWAGGLLAAAAGALISAASFRYGVRNVFFALITLSSAEVVSGLFENWGYIGGTSGIVIPLTNTAASMTFMSRTPYYEIILILVALLALGTWLLGRSKFGLSLIALREDEFAAEASGVHTFQYKVLIMTISAFCTALGGTFYAQFLMYIVPDTLLSFDHMISMLLGTIVGGAGTVLGPIIGSSLFSILSEILRMMPFSNSYQIASALKMFYALVLIVMVIRLPGGIVGLFVRRKKST
jgi:branched-chain amino acid transport system permease protein